jgi:hypothetical protein
MTFLLDRLVDLQLGHLSARADFLTLGSETNDEGLVEGEIPEG